MKALEELFSLVTDRLVIFKTIASIIALETRLAGLSILPTLLTLCFLLIALMGFWLVVLLALGYCILHFIESLPATIALVFGLNTVVLLILYKLLLSNFRKMSFEKTRAFLTHRESAS